ncbi:MAG: glycerate kinase [Ignavibacteria bacterium]|nr:glycerate kinase [Ignavibacteria bacterium]MBT8381912.1 glycerate kinase [Ignavibacteria bacterium]MBT8390595.1 glycerate kinase [Ignavibacteria bacterium]NNL22382.1 glycerate kinase [Ignavibacteriaceae bacterium]
MVKILIAPNSFKECADSVTLAELFSENLKDLSQTELIKKPISDGGDGFLNVCKYHFGGEIIKYKISSAYDESTINGPILYSEVQQSIYIESAEVLGLKVVPEKYRNPMRLSSKGIGELLLKISDDVKKDRFTVKRVYLGVGGTTTIDMGLGMMNILGLKLFDNSGDDLTVLPQNFTNVREIGWTKIELPFEVIPVADVQNSLTGEDNGVMIYGKQKGASVDQLLEIESGFNNVINLLKNKELVKSLEFLSGAGGGIPASLQIYYNSYCESSWEFILNDLELVDRMNRYDYLITGEGAFDKQTLFGKGAGLITMYYVNKVKNVFLVCGKIEDDLKKVLPENVISIELSNYFQSNEESIRNYELGITKACKEISNLIQF